MSELAQEKFDQINQFWNRLGPREIKAARDIVQILWGGSVLHHTLLERGPVPLYSLTLGEAVPTSGTAEMLEYGAAQFEGEKFQAFDYAPFIAADVGNRLVLPTWHAVRYETDRLSIEQVSGFVDFDASVEVKGDVHGDIPVLRLLGQPKPIKMIFED